MTKPKFNDTIYQDEAHYYKGTHARRGAGEIVMLDPVGAPTHGTAPLLLANGPALRDALIKAFPLPGDEPLADWEKELLTGLAAKPKPSFVPGMVLEYASGGGSYVVLPGDRIYSLQTHRTLVDYDQATLTRGNSEIVFDPRDAKALPSPLGVRVGDSVRRVQKGDHTTVTTEFQVNHIDRQIGFAYPKYGSGHPVDELEVIGREVPDRLPAGTITRYRSDERDLVLRKSTGSVVISGYQPGYEAPEGVLEEDVRESRAEVIYLPES